MITLVRGHKSSLIVLLALNKVLNTIFSVGLALSVVGGKVGGVGGAAGSLGKSATRSIGTKLARNAVVKVLGKSGTKVALKFTKKFISPFIKKIPIIGGLIDFALNYFVFKEPLGRFLHLLRLVLLYLVQLELHLADLLV